MRWDPRTAVVALVAVAALGVGYVGVRALQPPGHVLVPPIELHRSTVPAGGFEAPLPGVGATVVPPPTLAPSPVTPAATRTTPAPTGPPVQPAPPRPTPAPAPAGDDDDDGDDGAEADDGASEDDD